MTRVLDVVRRPRVVLVAVVVALTVTLAGYAVDAGTQEERTALGPGVISVDMDVVHSSFSEDRLVVREGTVVEFRIDNEDPIPHEFVVGPASVHRRHRTGSEAFHPPVPGEVSIGPNRTASTVYRFDDPGTVDFICHLPGHEAYGMVGEIEVLPA